CLSRRLTPGTPLFPYTTLFRSVGIDERDGDLAAPVLADGPLLIRQQRLGFSLQFPGHRASVPRVFKVGRAAAPSLRLGRGLGGGAAARPREADHRYEDADDARDLRHAERAQPEAVQPQGFDREATDRIETDVGEEQSARPIA